MRLNSYELLSLVLQYAIPGTFSMLFRIFGLGAKSKKHAILGLTVFLAISLVLPAALILRLGYQEFKEFVMLTMFLANISIFIISSDNVIKTCFLHLTQANIVFWISITASSARRLLDLSYYASNAIRLVLSCAWLFLGLRYCAKPLRFMADTIHSGWLGLFAIPTCILLAASSMATYCGTRPDYSAGVMLIVMTLLELSFVLYMRVLYYSLRESEQLAKEQNRQAMLEAELLSYDDDVFAAKRSRHDIRHHNAVLMELLESGDVAGAKEYLQTTDDQIAFTTLHQFCENPVANAFFRVYDRTCRKEGISLTVEGSLPKQISLNASEMGELIGNMLENAIHACEKVENFPYITVKFQLREGTLYGSVENSAAETVSFSSGMPQSERAGGGMGTKIIAEILEKHGGAVRWRQEQNVFYTQVILPL